MKTLQLTPSQEEAIYLVNEYAGNNKRLFILWYGGIRAGKTFGAVRALIEHSLDRENENYIVCGFVLRSIVNNVVPYFRIICESLNLDIKVVEGGMNPRAEIGSNRFLFYGGDKFGTSSKVQGATAAGLLIDEYENLNRDFVKQCEARVSKDGAIRIYTSNKGQKYSWAKKEYYDRIQSKEIEGIIIDSSPEENTFVNDDFWQEKRSEFDGNYLSRFMDNEFSVDFTPLYEPTLETIHDASIEVMGIYSYGRDHFAVPFYLSNEHYIMGEAVAQEPPIDLEIDNKSIICLVNSSAPKLGNKLRRSGHRVKGYLDGFVPYKYELAHRALASQNITVLEGADLTLEAIELYNVPGMGHPIVTLLESVAEYLTGRHRWQ